MVIYLPIFLKIYWKKKKLIEDISTKTNIGSFKVDSSGGVKKFYLLEQILF